MRQEEVMRQDTSSRPDLSGEVRFRVPLALVIPLVSLAIIGLAIFGFSRVLLSLTHEAATTIAIIMAINILGACAFLALRPDAARGAALELGLVALYPVLIAVIIAQTGVLEPAEGAEGAASGEQTEAAAPSAEDAIVAEGTAWAPPDPTIEVTAGEPTDYALENRDSVPHNLAIYPSEEETSDPGNALFTSPDADGGATEEFTIDPLDKGEYPFICDYHPNMTGTVVAE